MLRNAAEEDKEDSIGGIFKDRSAMLARSLTFRPE
jgi:hypothetical protein